MGRQQLKQCTALLNEIMKRDDAEYFLDPVDTDEVNNVIFRKKYYVALFLTGIFQFFYHDLRYVHCWNKHYSIS